METDDSGPIASANALRQAYEKRAESYQYHGPDGFPSRKHRVILRHLEKRRPDRFLEVGCGDGPYLAWSSLVGYRWSVGVDISHGILSQARKRIAHRGCIERASLAVADGATLPFVDGSVDLVLCTQVIEHIPDDKQAVEELARVLTPGGCLLISTDHANNRITKILQRPMDCARYLLRKPRWQPPFLHRDYSWEAFAELVTNAGLQVDHVSTFRFSWPSRLNRVPALVRLLDGFEERVIRRDPFSRWGDILLIVATKPVGRTAGRLAVRLTGNLNCGAKVDLDDRGNTK